MLNFQISNSSNPNQKLCSYGRSFFCPYVLMPTTPYCRPMHPRTNYSADTPTPTRSKKKSDSVESTLIF